MKIYSFSSMLLVLVLCTSAACAEMPQSVSADQAQLVQSGPGKLYCPNCGMNLVKFYKTSHALDGQQYCSLHCFCETNSETDSDAGAQLEKTQVVDFQSLKWIQANQAHYVVGSDVKGTMTMTSKYAFASQSDAEAFMKVHGGELISFDDVQVVARKALAKENQMIAKKRQSAAEKGAKIFQSMCKSEGLPSFNSIAEAKTHLVANNTCGKLKDGQYQAVAIYLMSESLAGSSEVAKIEVPEKAKCPVCGMYSALYPNWTAELITDQGTHYYFDGVKDLMKFYFEPAKFHVELTKEQMAEIRVSDYYNLKAMKASEAWYVVGSNVYGPMGNELIPFRTEDEARTFSTDHSGDSIVQFDQITKKIVYGLDQ